jgi:uncharacterized membrane protein YdcZ (DUF606 family)
MGGTICYLTFGVYVKFMVSNNDQYVAFTISDLNTVFGIVVIYASTCYIRRRTLWDRLSNLNCQQDIPWWCFIGGFMSIEGL